MRSTASSNTRAGWPSSATTPTPGAFASTTGTTMRASRSAFLKTRVKDAVKFISDFENAMAAEAKRRGLDGVICGHIHKAEMKTIDGILYCNDGDWVESCTALVEHRDGRLEIIEWAATRQFSMLAPNDLSLTPVR